MELYKIIIWVPSVETDADLAVVGGSGDEVDGDVVGGDEAREVEELVEMALCEERYHHHHHFICHFKVYVILYYGVFFSICTMDSTRSMVVFFKPTS
ncbi:hypothetical protein HanRHA438_Chr10g0446881 [Helianthus annuus]|nr:hypothetical protein HanIR_Chr10g0468721 [Helianthus annuus]KAJ0879050.1 hypothetical protein HanRHA438_Chr10g0446881 [Helianthus annuus]KAJ0883303.1 hypothetical protein HanPSC8_Chr10g0419941 [Helianthus annuus]